MTSRYGNELRLFREFLQKYLVSISIISVAIVVLLANRHRQSWLPYASNEGYNSLVYYGLIPLVLGALLLRTHPLNLGLRFGDYRFWLPASGLYLSIALPLVYFFSDSIGMRQHYPPGPADWPAYLSSMGPYLVGWEYLFRGFLLFGLKKDFKEAAVLVQMIPFVLLHFEYADIETVSCIVSGLVWGYICYRGNSFWPAVLMHLSVNFTHRLLLAGL